MSSANQVSDLPRPVTVVDEQIGVNGAIAAALTRWVGSMPVLYAALVVVGGWMALATWGPLHRADPYPFPFLLFLDNVVQLVLCLVILVGQRVLGAAADSRAVQTYENAEAIFEHVAELQGHLDRHDRALSRGVSLLESSPHPWIERHRVQPPPQAIDHAVTVNGRIAARLTQRLGTVWAFYLAAGTQLVWIVLAQLRVQRFDPYPYAFMSFLSTLAQLIFMIVIMVGQDVLSQAADRRSEQTFLDAEAILHECRRMKARLTAQDRVIDSLTGYTTTQVTEHLARAMHETYGHADLEADGQAADTPGQVPDIGGLPTPWDELPEEVKESNRTQARQIGEQLATIGCLMVPTFNPALDFAFEEDEVRLLARLEHESRRGGQPSAVVGREPGADGRTQHDQVPWEQLSDRTRLANLEAVRRMPAVLARAGFQVLRDGSGAQDGPHEADFTADEWDTLQRALMASGVLVALAEGVIDPEELFALVKKLRETSITHPRRFIRDLTAASTFDTGVPAGTRYADYQGPALETIRAATAIVARTAPAQLADFRTLLAEIAAVVADANKEGGFFGLGAQRRYGNEATAMAAVSRAAGLDEAGRSG
ncbi:DUF1003 domain-containing protein [Kitasatospora sp. NPDC008050]|uniref:DUF1003 domain-containing protein n=1 Tax=Kitasatospora sp. NPDC008050 TaxID=3364021 RepID=UPI0036EBA038